MKKYKLPRWWLFVWGDLMNRKDYSRHENNIGKMLLEYEIDHDIEEEWMLRILLDVMQGYTVRFPKHE